MTTGLQIVEIIWYIVLPLMFLAIALGLIVLAGIYAVDFIRWAWNRCLCRKRLHRLLG
jgi:hypothetical protein